MARPDPSAPPSLLLLLFLAQLAGRAAAASKAPACQEISAHVPRHQLQPDAHAQLVQPRHTGRGGPGGAPVLAAGGDLLVPGSAFFPVLHVHAHLPARLPQAAAALPLGVGAAKAGCSPLMCHSGFAWPERMSCDRLPVLGRDAEVLCMDYNRSEATTAPPRPFPVKPTLSDLPGSPASGSDCAAGGRWYVLQCRRAHVRHLQDRPVVCAVLHLHLHHSGHLPHRQGTLPLPGAPHHCPVSLLPCVSLGFLVRLVVGHASVACSREHSHIHYKTTGPALCTVVFLLVYFFGMASSIWWVILSLTWFLAASMKWGNKAIAGYAQYFHLAAWLIPSVKSITALALSSMDGDPVAGICYMGNQNLNLLCGFVLGPLVLYLLVGTLFLLVGFLSLFRIRSVIKQGGAKTDKLEKLMIRIGTFTLLYTVPASVVVACCLYEQHYCESWEAELTCACRPDSGQQRAKPECCVLMLKYFMCLVVGITSGVWIWSGKTVESWRRFTSRCCCRPRQGHKSGGATAAGDCAEASAALTGRTGPPAQLPPLLPTTSRCPCRSCRRRRPRDQEPGGS
ncbi:hypothetical protein FD754_024432 [Muntiacus muntjak]|uniref:G-protein coupled receptors family 2 profile 2 domain-containing protein n=1 Tax=Muntiacus muntjak TaxID=9888 RepID=A0A5N3UPK1_MUNMU|nr:hypothetical protein FD754_024432 [Muntiacus muntjak]